MRSGRASRLARFAFRRSSRLEGQRSLHHKPLELPTAADVSLREVEVLLVHPLELREEHRRYEPATAELYPAHLCIVRKSCGELTGDDVVPATDIRLLAEEAIQAFARVLPHRALPC